MKKILSHHNCCVSCENRTDRMKNRLKVKVPWLVNYITAKNIDLNQFKWICKPCYTDLLDKHQKSTLYLYVKDNTIASHPSDIDDNGMFLYAIFIINIFI